MSSTELEVVPEPLKPAVLPAKPSRLSHYMIGTKVRITVEETDGATKVYTGVVKGFDETLNGYHETQNGTFVWFDGKVDPALVAVPGLKDYTVETLE